MSLNRHFISSFAFSVAALLAAGSASAQRHRARCAAPQHDSAGHCCDSGEEWVEARARCVCLDPGGCQSPPVAPTPPPPAPSTAPVARPVVEPVVMPPAPPAPPPPPTCPTGMVRIDPVPFNLGSADATAARDETPPHRVTLGQYCIDRTEVTVGRYRACTASGACSGPTTISLPGLPAPEQTFWNQYCTSSLADSENLPMNCVDWSQASAYCRSIGGRLPTEAEWEFAARGVEPHSFPWGDQAATTERLNVCDEACVAMAHTQQRTWTRALPGRDGFGAVAPVGSFPAGASPFGLLDMAGNVSEWTGDWYGTYSAAPALDPTGPAQGAERVVRGGHWYSTVINAVRAAARYHTNPAVRVATLGFRCVHAPEAAPPPPPPPPPPAPTPTPIPEAPPPTPERGHHHGARRP